MHVGKHPTIELSTQDGDLVDIDEEIAELIQLLWALNIRTLNSCQSHCNFACKHRWYSITLNGEEHRQHIKTSACHNSVWVALGSASDLELLFDLIGDSKFGPRPDGADAAGKLCDGSEAYVDAKTDWTYCFLMEKRSSGSNIQPQITFPRSKLAGLVELLRTLV